MSIVYRVDLEDQTGSVIAIFSDFLNLSYTQRAAAKGSYTLTISGFDDRRLLFGDDYVIRVWMKDEAEGIPWTNTFNGIHKTYTDSLQENGQRVFTSFGPDGIELLDKAEILYPATSAGAEKSGIASTVCYEYVSENIGSSATTANGRQDDHTNPITMAPDLGEGPTWDGSAPWERLLDTLKKIRDYSINQGDRIDFYVNYTGGYTWAFAAGKIGTDRTAAGVTATSNGLNGAGNVPVIFGPAYGNVMTFVKSESRYNESNAITIVGKGEDLTRDVITALDSGQIARSPIAKRERVVNGANITYNDTAGSRVLAKANIDKYKARQKISFTPYRGAQIYYRDFYFLDRVTGEDFDGNRQDKQLTEVTTTVQKTVKAITEKHRIKFSDI